MRTSKWLIVGFILLMSAALVFAGGQKGDKGTEGALKLEWLVGSWLTQDHPDEQQAYDIEKVFEKEYPNIDVVVIPVAWEGLHDKYLLAAQTNNLPHIMTSEDFLGWTIEAASTGNLMDLTDFVNNDVGRDKWRTDMVIENASWKGRVWAFPYRNSTRALVWNKDMFAEAGLDPEQPPQTWVQLREYGNKVTNDDQYGFSYPLKRFCTVAPEYVRSIMDAYGADITNDDITEATINTPEAKQAITFWTDMVKKDKMIPMDILNNDDNNDYTMFSSEITAMCMVGPWTVDTFRVQNPDLNYGVTTIPSNKEGEIGRFGLVSMGWVVRKDVTEAEKEAIFTFLRYQIRPDVNVWFTDSLPVTATVPKDVPHPITGRIKNFEDDPRYRVFLKQLEYTYTSALLHPAGPKIAREVNMALQRIVLGQDADTVLDEANQIINELLEEAE
jgi:ABC-type glycerol-3-phosphate transport system substrate-binding protein